MKEFLKRNKLFVVFFYMTIWSSLYSSSMNRVVHIPLTLNRIFTVLLYAPLILSILWKLVSDIRRRKVDGIHLIYYAFGLYFCALEGYRLTAGMEVKESFYYSLIMFGSLALCLMLLDGTFPMTRKEFESSLFCIGIYMILYRLAYVFVVKRFLPYQLINENITSGILLLLLPTAVGCLCGAETKTKMRRLFFAEVTGMIAVILTTGSRSMFALLVVIVAAMLVCWLRDAQGRRSILQTTTAAVLIVVFLAVINFGDVRYFLFRETSLPFLNTQESVSLDTNDITAAENEAADASQPSDNQADRDTALLAVSRSDNMRMDLVRLGLEQVRRNLWFGTGDVEYPYGLAENYVPNQSPHNFILESLICYGLIGTAILAALFVALILKTGLFSRKNRALANDKVLFVLVIVFFFGFGMVEPIVYNPFMCPLFAVLIAYFASVLSGNGQTKPLN